MMRDALEESGSWYNARLAMELASVPRKRARRRVPMIRVARLSNLSQRDETLKSKEEAS